jgi:hypothetical protein
MSIAIPREVEEAVAQALVADSVWAGTWDAMSEVERSIFRARARVACRTMLNAWPGMKWHEIQVPDNSAEVRYMLKKTGVILPLTETPNA